MKILHMISRIVVGIVFVFSGFVKAIDPLGSTYKFTDYFNAFGLGFISPVVLPLAILLSSVELLMGISLLLGYRMKVTSWAVILFMSFFTVLTFILALTNPVTDCGCFGDALILTNWQTFGKNIVLMMFVIIIFRDRKYYQQIIGTVTEWSVLGLFFAGTVVLSVYNLNHLPFIDFRPFSKGANIPAEMIVPENMPADIYDTKLLYKNKASGKQEIFSIENFPDDSLWEFVSQESKLVSKGYEPPIHDFSISAPNGHDITEIVLKNPGYTFLLVSYNLNKANQEGLSKADKLNKIAQSLDNLNFYALTASTNADTRKVIDKLKLSYDFNNVDETVLKTIIRANPGLLLIKNGTVLANWHYNDFPDPANFRPVYEKLLVSSPLPPGIEMEFETAILPYLFKSDRMIREKQTIFLFILGFIAISLILRIFLEEPFLKRK
jgi:uncharacterized membrane protein YphA (DoxX/SURF4 family)